MWASAGIQTNPGTNAILADSGPVGGLSNYTFLVSATVPAAIVIAHRNAANNADVQTHITPVSNGLTPPFVLPIDVVAGGRVVVRLNAGITGSIQAAILRE